MVIYLIFKVKIQIFNFLPAFVWDTIITGEEGVAAFKGLLGDSALIRTVLGAFCLIAGIGMFQEQEWAWGMAIVLLSVIIVTTGGAVISSIVTPIISSATFNFWSWAFWIQLIAVSFAALGILWLLATKSRYS